MIVRLLLDRKQAVRNPKTGLITIEWLMKGTIIDHPRGHLLVRGGSAEPYDKESMGAVQMTENQLVPRQAWQQKVVDDQAAARDHYRRIAAGELETDTDDEDDDE